MSATTTYTPLVLEPASQAFVAATANPPFLYELTPDEARKVLDDVQAAPIAEGYFLTARAMAWFWDSYCPDLERRSEAFASPLRAGDEQLAGLPPALLIVDEADVLRDQGEAYAARLRNPLSETRAARAAVAQAIASLGHALHTA